MWEQSDEWYVLWEGEPTEGINHFRSRYGDPEEIVFPKEDEKEGPEDFMGLVVKYSQYVQAGNVWIGPYKRETTFN